MARRTASRPAPGRRAQTLAVVLGYKWVARRVGVRVLLHQLASDGLSYPWRQPFPVVLVGRL